MMAQPGQSRLIRIALTLAIFALLIFIVERLWMFGQLIGGVVSTLIAAWFVAFLIKPLVNYLRKGIVPAFVINRVQRRYGSFVADKLRLVRLPTLLAVALVYIVVLFIIIGSATIATATIIPQAAELIGRIPGFAANLPAQLAEAWASIAQRLGLDASALNQIISSQDLSARATEAAGLAAAQVLSVFAFTAGFISQVFLVLVLSLYIVVEDRLLIRQLFTVLPKRTHETALAMLTAVDRAFSGYLRGQVIGAVLRGVFTLVVFSLFGVNFGVVVSIAFAILSFIPLIGGPIGILIAAIVILIVRPEAVLPVTLLMFAIDQFVAYGVLPRLMKNMVGVPSLIALLAISVGVQLLGFWGLIFGMPIVGAVYTVLFEFYLPRRRKAEGLPEVDPSADELTHPPVVDKPQEPQADAPREREEAATPTLKRSR